MIGRNGNWHGKKLDEELGEFKETLEKNDINASSDEFGDVLFSMVNVARYFNLVAEDSLRQTNKKFEFRFRFIESELKKTGKSLNDASLEEMDQLWEKAKLIN